MSPETRARIEDLEFLLAMGEDRDRALARIGWNRSTADTMLRRWGRTDLLPGRAA